MTKLFSPKGLAWQRGKTDTGTFEDLAKQFEVKALGQVAALVLASRIVFVDPTHDPTSVDAAILMW
jgi:hypothetical protein